MPISLSVARSCSGDMAFSGKAWHGKLDRFLARSTEKRASSRVGITRTKACKPTPTERVGWRATVREVPFSYYVTESKYQRDDPECRAAVPATGYPGH
jgi:hypothetical protein